MGGTLSELSWPWVQSRRAERCWHDLAPDSVVSIKTGVQDCQSPFPTCPALPLPLSPIAKEAVGAPFGWVPLLFPTQGFAPLALKSPEGSPAASSQARLEAAPARVLKSTSSVGGGRGPQLLLRLLLRGPWGFLDVTSRGPRKRKGHMWLCSAQGTSPHTPRPILKDSHHGGPPSAFGTTSAGASSFPTLAPSRARRGVGSVRMCAPLPHPRRKWEQPLGMCRAGQLPRLARQVEDRHN